MTGLSTIIMTTWLRGCDVVYKVDEPFLKLNLIFIQIIYCYCYCYYYYYCYAYYYMLTTSIRPFIFILLLLHDIINLGLTVIIYHI